MDFRELFQVKKKKDEDLSASTVPGVRRLNNVPILICAVAVAIFVMIVFKIMHDRANEQAAEKKQSETRAADGAAQYAAAVTNPWADQTIIAAETHPPFQMPEMSEESESADEPKSRVFIPPQFQAMNMSIPAPPKVDWMEQHRERIRQQRLAALSSAVTNPTAAKDAADTGSRSRLSPGGDPVADYLNKVQQIQQGVTGTPPAGGLAAGRTDSASSVNSFERTGWYLDSSMQDPLTPYSLQAGFVIPAIMLSGINSELPGQVMAQVSRNVYDTPTGRYLLIPQGSRLIGSYNSGIQYGQSRILMAWQRIVFPDGRTLDLGAMPGADQAGYAGFHDQVNNHYFRLFTSAVLLSGVIAGVELSQNKDSKGSNTDTSDSQRASDALSEALGQSLGQALAELFRKNLSIAPTLEIRPGYRFNVMVTQDITFEEAYTPKIKY